MALLELHSISKAFSGTPVLSDVSFDVHEGEIVSLLGPSGCGKTTLLRVVAGLETADTGYVSFDGRRLDHIPVHRRGFGLMFQDYALFPHKDVASNVAFGLRMQHLPRPQVESRVTQMLDLVGLAGYETRRVYDLSGGEQQRVALARSLAPDPRLLMLDEPLGSLDRALREQLMNELRAILRRVGVTSLYVTHDQQEAFALADRVVIMKEGQVVQAGTPQAVYRYPARPWVAQFLELINLIPGRIVSIQRTAAAESQQAAGRGPSPATEIAPALTVVVSTPLGPLRTWISEQAPGSQPDIGQQVTVLLRPEGARLASDCPEEDRIRLEGTVRECSFRGRHYRLLIHHGSGRTFAFELAATAADLPQPGEPVALALRPRAISVIIESELGRSPSAH